MVVHGDSSLLNTTLDILQEFGPWDEVSARDLIGGESGREFYVRRNGAIYLFGVWSWWSPAQIRQVVQQAVAFCGPPTHPNPPSRNG